MLGRQPIPETIPLTLGTDYTLGLNAPAGTTFPASTAVRIDIYAKGKTNTLTTIASWAATVTTNRAGWRVESALADLIPSGAHFRIYITYPDTPSSLDHCWYKGEIVRDQ